VALRARVQGHPNRTQCLEDRRHWSRMAASARIVAELIIASSDP